MIMMIIAWSPNDHFLWILHWNLTIDNVNDCPNDCGDDYAIDFVDDCGNDCGDDFGHDCENDWWLWWRLWWWLLLWLWMWKCLLLRETHGLFLCAIGLSALNGSNLDNVKCNWNIKYVSIINFEFHVNDCGDICDDDCCDDCGDD